MTVDFTLLGLSRLGFFLNWNLPTDEKIRLAAEQLQADTLIIGVPSRPIMSPRWRPIWSLAKLEERLAAYRQAGLDPVVMPWAVRELVWLEEAIPWLRHLCEFESKPAALLDAEPDRRRPCWHRGGVRSEAAAEFVAEGLEGLEWGVSGLDRLHRTVKPLAKLAKFKIPQAYSFWKPKAGHWSQSRHTFPGRQQDLALDSWTQDDSGDGEVIMGLANYWQRRPAAGLHVRFPGLKPAHSLRLAAAETVALGVKAAWYWALEHVFTRRSEGPEVRKFFGIK